MLIKALPKPLRRHFVPAPDYASACSAAMQADDAPLTSALSRQLLRMTGTEIAQSAWDAASLPTHLRMRFVVTDDAGKPLDEGRDLEVLQRRYQDQVEESLVQFGDDSLERESVTDWNFGDLEECVDVDNRGVTMQGYPALQVKPDGSVGIRLFASVADANAAMPTGVRALYRLVLREEVRYLARKLPGIDVMALRFATFGSKQALVNDIVDAAIDHAFMPSGERPRTRDAFHGALESRRGELVGIANEMADSVADVLERHRLVARRIEGRIALSWIEAAADIKAQIASLIFEGFVTATGHTRLQRVPVYFEAMNKRLDAIDREPDKDRRRRSEFLPIWEAFQALPQPAGDGDYSNQHEGLRWAFEELRVQLFAQDLGTREKVSVSRLENRAGVDFALSNETANLAVLFNPYQFNKGGGSELTLGGFVNESGDNLLHGTLMARGKRQSGNSVYTLGAGFKAVYGELDIDEAIVINGSDTEKVGAVAIGLQAGVLLASSRHTPVELIGEAFMAPSITSFTDADRYTEIGARLQVEVIPQARAYLGYRRLSFDTNDYLGVRVDSGFHLGLNVSF